MQLEQNFSGQFGIEITGGGDVRETEDRGVSIPVGVETPPTAQLTLEDTSVGVEYINVAPAVAPTTLFESDEAPNGEHTLFLPDVDFTVAAQLADIDKRIAPFQFEDSQYYFLNDPAVADTFFDEVLTGSIPTGLEFGAGYTPTYLFKIDEDMPLWLAADPLQSAVVTQRILQPIINSQENNPERKIVYIPKNISHEHVNGLGTPIATYVYRNPDHSSPIRMPRPKYLDQTGKRLVLIADSFHSDEWPVYKGLLRDSGFDSDQFIPTDESYSYTPDLEQQVTHIFDSAGILNSQPD